MRGLPFIFILLIPALVALGHDMYLFYENYVVPKGFTTDLFLKEFKFSAFGFIWTTYDAEGYKNFVASVDPETWASIDYLLTYKAFYAGLGFAGILTAVFLVLAFFGIGPLATEDGRIYASDKKKDDISFRSGQGSKKMIYKRK